MSREAIRDSDELLAAEPKQCGKAPSTFTLGEVLGFLEKASELTGKNIHGVLDKIDTRLIPAAPLPDAAKPGEDGRGAKTIRFAGAIQAPTAEPKA